MGTAYNDSGPFYTIVSENDRTLAGSLVVFPRHPDQFSVFRSVIDFGIQVEAPEEIPLPSQLATYALRTRRPRPPGRDNE